MSDDLAAQVEANIATMQRAIDAAENAIQSQNSTGVLGWLQSEVTGRDPQATYNQIVAMDKNSLEPWRQKGRELANGGVYSTADSQGAMDKWVRSGQEIQQAITEIVKIDVDATLQHIVVGTATETVKDVGQAAVTVVSWASKILVPAAILAAIVVGYVVYRKVR